MRILRQIAASALLATLLLAGLATADSPPAVNWGATTVIDQTGPDRLAAVAAWHGVRLRLGKLPPPAPVR